MIAFASLFLGLILGPRPMEVVVGDEVAAVELLLDGRSLGMLREPPWRFETDFGNELAPNASRRWPSTPAAGSSAGSTSGSICPSRKR